MSTFVYNQARDDLAAGLINLNTAPVNVCLTNSSYGALVTDLTMTNVPMGARVISGVALTAQNIQNGIFSAQVPTFNAFTGAQVNGFLLYIAGASDALSRLLYYSSDGVGFPFTPAGFNYLIAYDQSSGGFFQV